MKVDKVESKSHQVPPPADTKKVEKSSSHEGKKPDSTRDVGHKWGPAVINNISTTNISNVTNTTTYNSNVSNVSNNVNTTNNYAPAVHAPNASPTKVTSYQMRRLADYQAALSILSQKTPWG